MQTPVLRNISIVIATYNREKSLERLLTSISKADYLGSSSVDIIISCDFSGNKDCEEVANNFDWKFGKKKVIVHLENLGLREHILFCGDLVRDYDGIIMLEDDLWVSPHFYKYVIQADRFFMNDSRIGQISLYSYQFDDYSASRFNPIKHNSDNYFMQVPSSWGQYWTREQWKNFKKAYDNDELIINQNDLLPSQVKSRWPETSWKKYFYKFIVEKDLFVVYPYLSLSTNFGEGGTHYASKVQYTQALMQHDKDHYKFNLLEFSKAIYDYNFELHKSVIKSYMINSVIPDWDIEFDLNGTKELSKITSKYLISSKTCKEPMKGYINDLIPQEFNIIYNMEGDFYTLGKTSDFQDEIPEEKILNKNLGFIPLIWIYKIRSEITALYENSTSYLLGKKFISFFNLFSIAKK